MNITITLTAAQEKGLAYVALSPQEWAENAVHNRCRIAIDEIYNAEVARMTADPAITHRILRLTKFLHIFNVYKYYLR